jgi:hypothetical protein
MGNTQRNLTNVAESNNNWTLNSYTQVLHRSLVVSRLQHNQSSAELTRREKQRIQHAWTGLGEEGQRVMLICLDSELFLEF